MALFGFFGNLLYPITLGCVEELMISCIGGKIENDIFLGGMNSPTCPLYSLPEADNIDFPITIW